MPQMVLIRHGESQWNLENRFTGWVDVPLSPKGEQEAREAGEKIRAFRFDEAFTSGISPGSPQITSPWVAARRPSRVVRPETIVIGNSRPFDP